MRWARSRATAAVGVSDTMASALWAAGALFSVAQDGVDGVNLHSYPGLSNALFDFTDSTRGWTGAVHPLYYGALLFAHAAPTGSRLLRVSLSGPPTLHGWATTGPGLGPPRGAAQRQPHRQRQSDGARPARRPRDTARPAGAPHRRAPRPPATSPWEGAASATPPRRVCSRRPSAIPWRPAVGPTV